MKALVLRVGKAQVAVKSEVIARADEGIALFVGFAKGDAHSDLVSIAEKVINLRIFEDAGGKLTYSVKDKSFPILCISNFTLCANTKKGRRPSFEGAMAPEAAKKFFNDFILLLKAKGINVKEGFFGEHMDINLSFDGPVNIILDSKS